MSPLVREYVTNLTTRFDEDLEASWEAETWRPLDGDGGAVHAAVVWDLFHMFVSAIEVFLVRVRARARVRVRVRVRVSVRVRVRVP